MTRIKKIVGGFLDYDEYCQQPGETPKIDVAICKNKRVCFSPGISSIVDKNEPALKIGVSYKISVAAKLQIEKTWYTTDTLPVKLNGEIVVVSSFEAQKLNLDKVEILYFHQDKYDTGRSLKKSKQFLRWQKQQKEIL